jgi:hypothetical protein
MSEILTSLAELKRMLLADPEVKAEYDRLGPLLVGEEIDVPPAPPSPAKRARVFL